MSRIKIKNFGPIKEGYLDNDGWMDIEKVTILIGNQGSGKSTVAKLISTFTWLEKAMVKGEIGENEFSRYNRFKKKHCAYQNLQNYFNDGVDSPNQTELQFEGEAFFFKYSNGSFSSTRLQANGYYLPKIMYVPAERNFVSAVDRPDKLKDLPRPLVTFLDEYEKAKDEVKEGISLPINNTIFEYDKSNKIAHIRGVDYRVRLSEASSGFQSIAPMYLVSRNLAMSLNREEDPSKRELSSKEQKKLQERVQKILLDNQLSEDVKEASLRVISSEYKTSRFLNIVEEAEQNLFPSSQRFILNSLLEFNNMNIGNKLIITTHSPYILNFLSIAIQGKYLKDKIEMSGRLNELLPRLDKIVNLKSLVAAYNVVVYQLDESSGIIKKLPNREGILSDRNFLNIMLAEGNNLFDSLLEIEEDL